MGSQPPRPSATNLSGAHASGGTPAGWHGPPARASSPGAHGTSIARRATPARSTLRGARGRPRHAAERTRRDCNPTFAVGREQGGTRRTAAAAVRAFRASYRAALERWCAGVRNSLFPAGTWWMHTFHGVSVNDAVLAV